MMKKLALTLSLLIAPSQTYATSWPGTSPTGTMLQWGLNKTVTPYQIGIFLGTTWYSIGTITSGGTYLPTFTMTGDCSLSAGAITCTTLNGVGVGTSGTKIPLLNGANTWSAAQTFSATAAFAGATFSSTTTFNGGLVVTRITGTTNTSTTLSSCGTSPTLDATSTDMAGEFTTGSAGTACTVNFGSAFANDSHCVVTPMQAVTIVSNIPYISSQTNALFTVSNLAASSKYSYHCIGM